MRIGEKVPQAEIPGVRRTRRPGQTAQNDRRPGENLVPKSSHQMEVSENIGWLKLAIKGQGGQKEQLHYQ